MSGITIGHQIVGNVTSNKGIIINNINVLDNDIPNKQENIGTMKYDNEEYVLYKFPKNKKHELNIKETLDFNGLFYKDPTPLKPQSRTTEITKFKEISKLYEEKVQEVLDHGSVYIMTNISNQIMTGGQKDGQKDDQNGGQLDDSFNKNLTIEQKNEILEICSREKTFTKCNKLLSSNVPPNVILRQTEVGPRKILIIGGGPVGLLTGYLFKQKLGNNINVILLENRLESDGTRKDFQRIQTMRMPPDIWEYLPKSLKDEFKRLRLGIDLHKKDSVIKKKLQVLPIMLIEKLLLDAAKNIGVILRYTKSYESVDKIKRFVTKNNIDIVIDASGGRIKSDARDELVKLHNEIRTAEMDWYEPILGYLMAMFKDKYTMTLRNPSHMIEDFRNIAKGIMLCHFASGAYNDSSKNIGIPIAVAIQKTFKSIVELKNIKQGIFYEIVKDAGVIVCNLYIMINDLNYKIKYNTQTTFNKLSFEYNGHYHLDNDITSKPYRHINIYSHYDRTKINNLINNIDKQTLQKNLSNITYDSEDNFYYYTKPNTIASDYQFGYITFHGKLIGKNRLHISSDFDYNKTNNWLTSCGIDWDDKKIIIEGSDIDELHNFTDPKLPADFPYTDVYDYLAISLTEREYKQILEGWKSFENLNGYKQYLSFNEFKNLITDQKFIWLKGNINRTLTNYYTYPGYNKKFDDLADPKYDLKIARPFEIRPGFRAKSSSVSVFNDVGDILYVMTGDALFQPHFYGTGGFRRGAEISKHLADLVFEHFFGAAVKIDSSQITEIKTNALLLQFDGLATYNTYLDVVIKKISTENLWGIFSCDTKFGVPELEFMKGTDEDKLILIGNYMHLNKKIKFAVKIYFSKKPDFENNAKLPTELYILNILKNKPNPNNLFRHSEMLLIKGTCPYAKYYIKPILDEYCKDKTNICKQTIRKELDNTIWNTTDKDKNKIYNNAIKYSLSRYAEYGTLDNIIKDNLKINILTNKMEQIDLNQNNYILILLLQLLWQLIIFSQNQIIHADIIPNNIFCYVDTNYIQDANKYYEYNILDLKFYIKVLPFIFKFADYGKSKYSTTNIPNDIAKTNIKNFKNGLLKDIRKYLNTISDTFADEIDYSITKDPLSDDGVKGLLKTYIDKYKDTIIKNKYTPDMIIQN